MPTIRLTPSNYSRSNTNYITITNPNNMYDNTSDTSDYATLRGRAGRSNGNSTYYAFINGFNFNDIPSNAQVTDFTIKIKAYRGSYMATGNTNYRICLASQASNNYKIGNTVLSQDITTSTSGAVYEIPTGNLTWAQLVGYGSNFSIDIPLRNSSTSSSNYPYVYVYGAEIEVTYTIPNPVNITSILVSGNGTISPSGTSTYYAGDEYKLTITPTDPSDPITLEFNGTDISSQLEAHYAGGGNTDISAVPESSVTTGFNRSGSAFYQSSSTQSDAWLRYAIGHSAESPYSTSNTSNTYVKDGTNDANTMGWMNYPFDFSSIPANAEIVSVNVKVYGASESTYESAAHADVELYSGTTLKSTRQTFPSTSNGIMTINDPGEWTRAELQNAQLRFIVGYYGGRILGATWTVTYEVPSSGNNPEYYTYTYTVSTINTILLEVTIGQTGPIEPPEEDPQYTYWPITISSINATTNPANGTTRVVEGSNMTVTISPTDPQLTLALDNGVDITSQLVGGVPTNTYTVDTQVSGASYGFNLNSSTGYYRSTNDGVGSSASVARVYFDLESNVLVTIQYINQGESQADYGMFGKIDTTVSTTGNTYEGSSASPDDPQNYYYMCAAASDASTSTKTLTYEIPMGQHYIDIKYAKDQASNSGLDSLQWKILSIEATSTGGDYTYTLTNIHGKHSLIFVFGDVDYYFITSSGTSGAKLFPDGQQVKLAGDSYKLTIIPDSVNSSITATDNGNNITSSLVRLDGYDKNNQPIVNYTSSLSNISVNHNIVVSIGGAQIRLYIKENGTWVAYTKAYKKINGSWVEQADLSSVFNTSTNYRKGN